MISGGILRSKQLIITISIIFTIYAAVLGTLVYLLGNVNNLNSISIVISAISGGGFVPTSTFLSDENVADMLVLIAGMIISFLPFAFHYAVFSKRSRLHYYGQKYSYILALFSYRLLLFIFC